MASISDFPFINFPLLRQKKVNLHCQEIIMMDGAAKSRPPSLRRGEGSNFLSQKKSPRVAAADNLSRSRVIEKNHKSESTKRAKKVVRQSLRQTALALAPTRTFNENANMAAGGTWALNPFVTRANVTKAKVVTQIHIKVALWARMGFANVLPSNQCWIYALLRKKWENASDFVYFLSGWNRDSCFMLKRWHS
jgi:hypothetical protein